MTHVSHWMRRAFRSSRRVEMDKAAPVDLLASLSSTFEIENIKVNVEKSFAYLDFSIFWK